MPTVFAYRTIRRASMRTSFTRLLTVIVLTPILQSCAEQAPQSGDTPAPKPALQLAAAADTYQWTDTVENPGRTAAIPTEAGPNDWPGFRGPNRDGRATGVTFSTDWTANPPKERWRRRVGDARSSFAIVGNYAFTQEQRGPNEVVVCYDAETGDEVWINAIADRFTNIQGNGPRATPAFANGRLFTLGAKGTLQCLDAVNGAVIWTRNLPAETGAIVPHFGYASSPLIVDNLVIVFAGNPRGKGVAAFNADSGSIAWTAGNAKLTYASPQYNRINETEQVLMISNVGIEAFTPNDGAPLWDHAWPPQKFARCIQPIITDDNGIILGTPTRVATRRIDIQSNGDTWTATEAWTRDGFAPYFNDVIYHNGYCYASHRKNLECIDAATGQEQWRERIFGGQMILLPEMNAILALTEKGEVMVFNATPEGFQKRATMPNTLPGETLNHPAIANGKLFLRNETEAACYELPQ